MKNLFIVALLLTASSYGQVDASKKESAEKILAELVHTHKAVGAVAGVLEIDQFMWYSAQGHMDFKMKTKINTETLIRTASIAKSMTAVAVMQLYEKGDIELDKPVQHYIKEFPRNVKGDITIRQLLNHSSGIKGYASNNERENKKNFETLTAAMSVFVDRETIGIPGNEYNYTTYGYVVLGVLIERVTGMSFEAYIKEHIWHKAGMTHTGVEKHDESAQNKSKLFHKNKRDKIKKVKKPNDLSNRVPGGGFHTTVVDMLKFGEAVLNNTLVKPETLALMLENNGLRKEGNPYGFGWFLYGGKSGHADVYGHSGGQTGASTQLLIIPSRKTVIVVMSNTSGGWGEVIGTAAQLNDIFKSK